MKHAFINRLSQNFISLAERFPAIGTQFSMENILEIAENARVTRRRRRVREMLEIPVAQSLEAFPVVIEEHCRLQRALLVKLALESCGYCEPGLQESPLEPRGQLREVLLVFRATQLRLQMEAAVEDKFEVFHSRVAHVRKHHRILHQIHPEWPV